MSTATIAQPTRTLSRAEARPQHFGRALAVEFRKLWGTRTTKLLLLVCAVAIVGLAVPLTLFAEDLFGPIYGEPWAAWPVVAYLLRLPQQWLLAALLVLITTIEWTSRSAMTTFTLTPRRGHVVAAKAVVATSLTVAVWAACAGAGWVATELGRNLAGATAPFGTMPLDEFLGDAAVFGLLMATAFGVGLLVQNGALAIAIALISPSAIQILRSISDTISEVVSWIDLTASSQQVLVSGMTEEWPKLVTSVLVWIVLPLVLGTMRTMRREAQ